MNRIVHCDIDRHILVECRDESAGGNCCDYVVRSTMGNTHATVGFQVGGIKDAGVNGCDSEDLLRIVIDRIQYFQENTIPCRENAVALEKLREAIYCLEERTADRKKRCVEGTIKP